MKDWRNKVLPDGRSVEFVDATWGTDTGDEPAGTVPIEVTYLVDGEVGTATVLLNSAQVEEAFGSGRETT